MESNWIKVFTTENAIQAEMIKQGLIESEIPAVVMNKRDSSYLTFGVLTVMVHPDNFDKASAYILENGIE